MFSKGKVWHNNYNFEFGGKNIEGIKYYEYLGLLLNYDKLFRKEVLKDQTKKALCSVIIKDRKFDLPVDGKIVLFTTMLTSVLNYSYEICEYFIFREVELLHLKLCKQNLSFHKHT